MDVDTAGYRMEKVPENCTQMHSLQSAMDSRVVDMVAVVAKWPKDVKSDSDFAAVMEQLELEQEVKILVALDGSLTGSVVLCMKKSAVFVLDDDELVVGFD